MDSFYSFSTDDIAALREIIRKVRHDSRNTRNRLEGEEITGNSPEVYVVRTPSSGIPGPEPVGTGSPPSSESFSGVICPLYRLNFNTFDLEAMGYSKTVYSLASIAGNKWVRAIRDKYGVWWADSAISSGSGGGSADNAVVTPTSSSPQTVNLLSGGSISAYPALANNTTVCWLQSTIGDVVVEGQQYVAQVVSTDTSGKIVYQVCQETATVKVTSLTPQTVSLKTGESVSAYPAASEVLAAPVGTGTGKETTGLTGWFYPLNGEVPVLNHYYNCRLAAFSTSNVPVWATELASVSTAYALTVENAGGTQDAVIMPPGVIQADNLVGASYANNYAFGRIQVSIVTGNTVKLDWQGLRVYSAGLGYFGPEPDLEIDGGTCPGGLGQTIGVSVTDDTVDQRVKVTLYTIGDTMTLTIPLCIGGTVNPTTCVFTPTYRHLTLEFNCGLLQSFGSGTGSGE